MSVIDTLIFDRNNDDLLNDTDKAYISYTDLNRIEQACKYIADELGVNIVTKEWTIQDFRTEAEMERLRNNIDLLRRSYYTKANTPQVPNKITFTSIYQANNIEKILYDIDYMYQNILSGKPRLSFRLGKITIGNRR